MPDFTLRCQDKPATQGKFYTAGNHAGGVALGKVAVVLGAGNQGFLTMCDVLHMLFVDGAVVILKHNPVRDYNDQWVKYLFAPLIREGFVHSFTGDDCLTETTVR